MIVVDSIHFLIFLLSLYVSFWADAGMEFCTTFLLAKSIPPTQEIGLHNMCLMKSTYPTNIWDKSSLLASLQRTPSLESFLIFFTDNIMKLNRTQQQEQARGAFMSTLRKSIQSRRSNADMNKLYVPKRKKVIKKVNQNFLPYQMVSI